MKFELKLLQLFSLTVVAVACANCLALKSTMKHGCSAYGCSRVCVADQMSTATPGDNGFSLEVEGLPQGQQNMYVPDSVYKGRCRFTALAQFPLLLFCLLATSTNSNIQI